MITDGISVGLLFYKLDGRSSLWLTIGVVRVWRTSRVRRRLLRTIQRHFTLRRASCSFEVYEIGCASPLTGSVARDDGMNSCFSSPPPSPFVPFFPLPFICMYVTYTCASPSFFHFLVKVWSRGLFDIPEFNIRNADASFFVEAVSTICLIARPARTRSSRTSFSSLTAVRTN